MRKYTLHRRYGRSDPFFRPTVIVHRSVNVHSPTIYVVLGPGLPWLGLECYSFADAMKAVDEWYEKRRNR
jgi:hypothetical protein